MANIIVVGSGIAGLSAGWKLRKAGINATILEANATPGGRMCSRKFGDTWIDCGAELLASTYLDLLGVLDDIGLADKMFRVDDGPVKFSIKRGERFPELIMGDVGNMFSTKAFSWRAKARLALLLPPTVKQAWKLRKASETDEIWRGDWADNESVGDWLDRINPEFLEYFIEPFLGLMCGWKPEQISKGYLLYMNATSAGSETFTFAQGLGLVTRTLASRLDVQTGCRVRNIHPSHREVEVEWQQNGETHNRKVDGVVLAVQGTLAADLVEGLGATHDNFLRNTHYVAQSLSFFRLAREAKGLPHECVYMPRSESDTLIQISQRAYGTNPDGEKLLRISTRHDHTLKYIHESNDSYLDFVEQEAARFVPDAINAISERTVSRWPIGIPTFAPGYLARLNQFLHAPPVPRLAFAGDYLANATTGAACRTGISAAEDLLKRLE